MTSFLVIGHTASTDASFPLDDLPGMGGRMDLISRVIASSLFLSHGIRTDTICDILLLGPPHPGRIIRFDGSDLKSLSPDERNIASYIKKALAIPAGRTYRKAGPGLFTRKGTLGDLITEKNYAVLDESGTDIRTVALEDMPDAFLLSDNRNFTEDERSVVRDLPKYALGPAIVHADHAIVLILNEIDRRRSGWI
ncbi:MAG TPA: tRNA (pseudouridine(54)-N(1))-methyltransferase TrmY [Methanospirillum sp.]|nr:tRNA (pseudouridine(54)-N(1))-methyltransferase TrmY [Methanospirillum sp.]